MRKPILAMAMFAMLPLNSSWIPWLRKWKTDDAGPRRRAPPKLFSDNALKIRQIPRQGESLSLRLGFDSHPAAPSYNAGH